MENMASMFGGHPRAPAEMTHFFIDRDGVQFG